MNIEEIADKIIEKVYPDIYKKGRGWWGEKRIPNYGILYGAILSSLEKVQTHVDNLGEIISDQTKKRIELEYELEKEKERVSEAEFLRNGMQERVNELFIENERLKERVIIWQKEAEAQREKVKELTASFGSSLAFERIRELEIELKEGDYWQQRAKEFLSLGGCPVCFATDEEGHKEKCEWGIIKTKLEKLVEAYKEADDKICYLCRIIDPQHKNCVSCGEREYRLQVLEEVSKGNSG